MMTQQTEKKNQAQKHTVRTKNAMKCYKKTRKIQLKLSESYFVISLLTKCTSVMRQHESCCYASLTRKMGQRKCRKLLIKKSNCTKTVLKRNTINKTIML